MRVRSREEAEDLAGKTFLKTWDYIAKGHKIENLRAFIFRVAHNLVVDFYKTNKRDKEVSIHNFEDTTIDIPDEHDIQGAAAQKSDLKDIQKMLTTINKDYAEVITLRYMHDFSNEEIAQITGMSNGAVRTKLSRALESLRKQFQK